MSLFQSNPAFDPSGPGKLFDYEVVAQIGEGAGSIIYAVTHPESRQIYALKHVIRKGEKDIRFIEQLQNEFEVGKNLNHPNLRKVVDYRENKSLLFKVTDAALVLELFDGSPMEIEQPRALTTIIHIAIETAKAIGAMHKAGFVHCDLKPNNIMLGPGGKIKVIDLGQACSIGMKKARIQGTPDYIAPEQVKCLPVTPQTDIFNFGATFYWALTTRKMPTLFTVGRKDNSFLVDDQILAPAALNPIVPETLSNFVMECVRTNPSKRPADMSEVTRRLEIIEHVVNKQLGASRNMGVA